jgi:hypothetical protein
VAVGEKKFKLFIAVLFLAAALFPARSVSLAGEKFPEIVNEELDTVRADFFEIDDTSGNDVLNLIPLNLDESRIIEVPQEYLTPDPRPQSQSQRLRAAPPAIPVGGFAVNDERDFRARVTSSSAGDQIIKGKLLARSAHVNVWVLDDASYFAATGNVQTVSTGVVSTSMAQEIADIFNGIYERMTDPVTGFAEHAGVTVSLDYSNVDLVGDLGNDGKVNFLLYDLYGDGTSTSGFTAGFFANGDFFTDRGDGVDSNYLDMLHIDIGVNQGFQVLSDPDDKWSTYGTLAHEFQHLLFYMYFGAYAPNGDEYSWINESIADDAKVFFTRPGFEINDWGRTIAAAMDSYANGSDYGDFVNFNGSQKNYGMGQMLSRMLHKKTNGLYAHNVFNYFKTAYPPAANVAARNENVGKIGGKSMSAVFGDVFKAALGLGSSSGGEAAFAETYYLFMENFAADGGAVQSATPAQTIKL